MSTISIIAAIDVNNAIGKNGRLLCHLPADLEHFKKTTSRHSVVMGRKTFESLPNGALPNRRNIVLSHNKDYTSCNVETVSSLYEAIDMCRNEDEVFIIGGAEVYKQALNVADKLYLTIINHSFDSADTFFPDINKADWEKVSSKQYLSDQYNKYDYTFEVYHSIS